MSEGSFWASFVCHRDFLIAGRLERTLVCDYSPSSYSETVITLKAKHRMNFHSLSESVSELLENGRKSWSNGEECFSKLLQTGKIQKFWKAKFFLF